MYVEKRLVSGSGGNGDVPADENSEQLQATCSKMQARMQKRQAMLHNKNRLQLLRQQSYQMAQKHSVLGGAQQQPQQLQQPQQQQQQQPDEVPNQLSPIQDHVAVVNEEEDEMDIN